MTLLEKAIAERVANGYLLFEKVTGMYSISNRSAMGRAITRARRQGYETMSIAKGGRVPAGIEMALMVKNRDKKYFDISIVPKGLIDVKLIERRTMRDRLTSALINPDFISSAVSEYTNFYERKVAARQTAIINLRKEIAYMESRNDGSLLWEEERTGLARELYKLEMADIEEDDIDDLEDVDD